MRDKAVPINAVTFNSLMDVAVRCCDMEQAASILGDMVKSAYQPDLITFSTLIKGYCYVGEVEKAVMLADELEQRGLTADEIVYNSLLDGCGKAGNVSVGRHVLDKMLKSPTKPSNVTFCIFVKLLGRTGHVNEAAEIVEQMKSRYNVAPSRVVIGSLLRAFVKGKQFDKANDLLTQMPEVYEMKPDSSMFGAVVAGLIAQSKFTQALDATKSSFSAPVPEMNKRRDEDDDAPKRPSPKKGKNDMSEMFYWKKCAGVPPEVLKNLFQSLGNLCRPPNMPTPPSLKELLDSVSNGPDAPTPCGQKGTGRVGRLIKTGVDLLDDLTFEERLAPAFARSLLERLPFDFTADSFNDFKSQATFASLTDLKPEQILARMEKGYAQAQMPSIEDTPQSKHRTRSSNKHQTQQSGNFAQQSELAPAKCDVRIPQFPLGAGKGSKSKGKGKGMSWQEVVESTLGGKSKGKSKSKGGKNATQTYPYDDSDAWSMQPPLPPEAPPADPIVYGKSASKGKAYGKGYKGNGWQSNSKGAKAKGKGTNNNTNPPMPTSSPISLSNIMRNGGKSQATINAQNAAAQQQQQQVQQQPPQPVQQPQQNNNVQMVQMIPVGNQPMYQMINQNGQPTGSPVMPAVQTPNGQQQQMVAMQPMTVMQMVPQNGNQQAVQGGQQGQVQMAPMMMQMVPMQPVIFCFPKTKKIKKRRNRFESQRKTQSERYKS